VGSAGLNVLTRRGLDPEIELTAIEAGEAFFERRHLHLVELAS